MSILASQPQWCRASALGLLRVRTVAEKQGNHLHVASLARGTQGRGAIAASWAVHVDIPIEEGRYG
jgi:hypothetical protein